MKTGTKIIIGVAAAAAITGAAYYRAAKNIKFQLWNFKFNADGTIGVLIQANNTSAVFGFPVPAIDLQVFDSNQQFLGVVHNSTLQWVEKNGISYIQGTLQPNYNILGSAINYLLGQVPTQYTLSGYVRLGSFNIPVTQTIAVSGIGKVTLSDVVRITKPQAQYLFFAEDKTNLVWVSSPDSKKIKLATRQDFETPPAYIWFYTDPANAYPDEKISGFKENVFMAAQVLPYLSI